MGAERRVCVEFLPPDELARKEVRALLLTAGVAPMLAAPTVDASPTVQAEADGRVARVLATYRQVGLLPCVWPLLADVDGYWPSALNAERFVLRVRALRAAAAAAGAPYQAGDVVAVDLEPPLPFPSDADGAGHRMPRLSRCSPARFAAATATLSALCASLRRDKLRTLAIAYPLVSADPAGGTGWQRRCAAPLSCGWDRIGVMTYSSMVAGYSRGLLDIPAARRYGYRVQERLGVRFPGRAAAFIGICGHGKLGDEPAHKEPRALALDAAAAWAAGAQEVTAFCLEGILSQPDPLAWLQALSAPPLVPPGGFLGEAAFRAQVVLGHLLPMFPTPIDDIADDPSL